MLIASELEHAEIVIWRHDRWRCELWIVDQTPRLRLFEHETVVREFQVAGASQVSLYDGSWAEYAQQPDAVIEKDV